MGQIHRRMLGRGEAGYTVLARLVEGVFPGSHKGLAILVGGGEDGTCQLLFLEKSGDPCFSSAHSEISK